MKFWCSDGCKQPQPPVKRKPLLLYTGVTNSWFIFIFTESEVRGLKQWHRHSMALHQSQGPVIKDQLDTDSPHMCSSHCQALKAPQRLINSCTHSFQALGGTGCAGHLSSSRLGSGPLWSLASSSYSGQRNGPMESTIPTSCWSHLRSGGIAKHTIGPQAHRFCSRLAGSPLPREHAGGCHPSKCKAQPGRCYRILFPSLHPCSCFRTGQNIFSICSTISRMLNIQLPKNLYPRRHFFRDSDMNDTEFSISSLELRN